MRRPTPTDGDTGRGQLLIDAFTDCRRTMFAVARKVVGNDIAADVVQEVMTRAWRQRASYDPTRSSPAAYLVMMTKSVSIDFARGDSARRAREDRLGRAEIAASYEDDLYRVVRDEEALRLSSALCCLTADERDLLLGAFYGEVSYRQLAVTLGLPEGTVKARIRKALRKLRQALTDLGGDDGRPADPVRVQPDLGTVGRCRAC